MVKKQLIILRMIPSMFSREHDLIRMISVTHFEEKKYFVSNGIEQMAEMS